MLNGCTNGIGANFHLIVLKSEFCKCHPKKIRDLLNVIRRHAVEQHFTTDRKNMVKCMLGERRGRRIIVLTSQLDNRALQSLLKIIIVTSTSQRYGSPHSYFILRSALQIVRGSYRRYDQAGNSILLWPRFYLPILPLSFTPRALSIFARTAWLGTALPFSYSWTTLGGSLISLASSPWLFFFSSRAF